jgi:prenylcysteine oxidase / farnesylcysteine lyase
VRSDIGSREYKAVILAAPFHTSSIDVPASIAAQVPPQPYVHLHVTHVLTPSPFPNPAYFGLEDNVGAVPSLVLTTHNETGEEPEFNSLSYHGVVEGKSGGGEDEWVVKLFSKKRLDDEVLRKLLKGKVNWVHRQEVRRNFFVVWLIRLMFFLSSGMPIRIFHPRARSRLSS